MGTMHEPVVSADPRYRADPPADDTIAPAWINRLELRLRPDTSSTSRQQR